jgi:DNA-binding NarL/FixJ family response regulator
VVLRVLVVDDYEPVRRVVRLILEVRDDLQIVGEASDGLEAVQKAQELRPDLILLDIDLPRLNGIQAARRLRDLVPRAKVLFLSVESSSDVVREALNAGGVGYIYKLHTASELLPAIEMVLRGKQFVSSHLEPFANTEIGDEHLGDRPRPGELPAPRRRRSHEVGVYPDDASFVDGFTRFIEDTLELENPVIVIVTESHRNSLFQRLQARGWDIPAAMQKGSYISLDVSDTLSKFMVNDWPDSSRFAKVVGDLIKGAANAAEGKHAQVAACGECGPALWALGKAEAAIQVAHLWDEIADIPDVNTLCGYLGSRPPSKGKIPGADDYGKAG